MKTNKDLYKNAFDTIKATDSLKESLMKIPSQNITNKKPKRKFTKLTAAIVAAIILILSCTGVYAGVQFYKMYTQKEGNYSQKLIIEKENTGVELYLDKKNSKSYPKYVTMKLDYLPKNFEPLETDIMKYSYKDTYAMGGISMLFYDVSGYDKIESTEKNVIDSELTTLNGNKCLYVQYEVTKEQKSKEYPGFDKHMYIYYEKYDLILFVYGGTDMSKDLLYKIFDNATAVKGTYDNAYPMENWSDKLACDIANEAQRDESEDEMKVVIRKEDNNFVNVGDTVTVDAFDKDCDTIKVEATLDDLVVADNLDMLNDNPFSPDMLDENGKLKPLKVSCYDGGDGVNSVDKLMETKNFNVKFVYSTVTYRNNTDRDVENMGIIQQMVEKSGKSIFEPIDKLQEKYNTVDYDDNYTFGEMVYNDFFLENTNDPNFINIPANGEKTIHVGMFVLEDDLKDGVYLILNIGNDTILDSEKSDSGMTELIYRDYVITELR